MALVNPNIAMSFRQPEFTPRNALADFAQMQQIQGGQQAQELARFQLGAAQRAESVQNALTDAYKSSIDPEGNIDYNKLVGSLAQGGGASQIPGVLKTRAETAAAKLAQTKTQGEIEKNEFELQDRKLKFAWNAVGSSATPEAAIAELIKGASQGVFGMQAATSEIQQLRSMNPDQFRQYRIQKISDILNAKDKLGFMLPKTVRQDAGGQILSIQDNPMLPGYGQPIASADITKTPTIGERTAQGQLDVSQGQLRVAQGNAKLAQDKFDFEKANPGFDLKEDANGNFFAINKRTNVATPVMVEAQGKPLQGVAGAQLGVSQQNARLAQEKFDFEKANPGFDLKEDANGNFFAINKRTNVATPVTISAQGKPLQSAAGAQLGVSQGQLRVSQQNARLAQEKFDFEKANPGFDLKEDADGNFFAINKRTNVATRVTIGGAAPAAAVAPAAPGAGMPGPRVPAPAAVAPGQQLQGKTGALTESQGNATAFGLRMLEAQQALKDLEKSGVVSGGRIKGVVEGTLKSLVPFQGEQLAEGAGAIMNVLPGFAGGPSGDQQLYQQAKTNFITAVLRKESGAAIGLNEFQTEDKKYFPQAGDTAKVIERKQKARDLAVEAMKIQAGPGAKNIKPSNLSGATANDPLGLGIGGNR